MTDKPNLACLLDEVPRYSQRTALVYNEAINDVLKLVKNKELRSQILALKKDMSKTPILDTIRLLVKINGYATPATITSLMKGVNKKFDQLQCMQILSENLDILKMKDGKVYGTRSFHFTDLVKYGKMKIYRPYKVDDYGWPLFDALEFQGEDDLKKKYETHAYGGGIGDVHHYSGTKDCPELREELHARGFVEFQQSMCDITNFWIE